MLGQEEELSLKDCLRTLRKALAKFSREYGDHKSDTLLVGDEAGAYMMRLLVATCSSYLDMKSNKKRNRSKNVGVKKVDKLATKLKDVAKKTTEYVFEPWEAPVNECPICIRENIARRIVFPCGHYFCEQCGAKYYIEKLSTGEKIFCPICKKLIGPTPPIRLFG
jgi:hypothetical protein